MSNLLNVAIIISCKNAEKEIEKCLSSLLGMSYPREKIKIIVIDASSNNKTFEVLTRFNKEHHDLIRIFHRKNFTISQAYNFAFKFIDKEEIIAFVDADCSVKRDWLRTLTRHFDDPIIAAAGGFYETPHDVNLFSKLLGLELEARAMSFKKYVSRLPTGNIAIRSEVLKEIGCFDERLPVHQDTDLGYRIIKSGYRIIYDRNANVYHYNRPSPISFFKQQFRYALHASKLYLKHPKGIKGDHITSFTMNIEPFIYIAIGGFLLFSSLSLSFYRIALFLILALLVFYFFKALIAFFRKRRKLSLALPILFLIRGMAWSLGLIVATMFNIRSWVFKRTD